MVDTGRDATLTHVVGEADSATALGSGDVPVLATPRLLALAEAATVAAVAGALPEGATSVGTRVELDHVRATPMGATVRVTAVLVAADGSRLEFEVTAEQDEDGGPREVARGRVVRAVVDRERFVTRLPRAD